MLHATWSGCTTSAFHCTVLSRNGALLGQSQFILALNCTKTFCFEPKRGEGCSKFLRNVIFFRLITTQKTGSQRFYQVYINFFCLSVLGWGWMRTQWRTFIKVQRLSKHFKGNVYGVLCIGTIFTAFEYIGKIKFKREVYSNGRFQCELFFYFFQSLPRC
jgi:hypothetical protein